MPTHRLFQMWKGRILHCQLRLTKGTPKSGKNVGKKMGKLTLKLHETALEGVEVVVLSPSSYRDWGTPTTLERSDMDSMTTPW